MAKTGMMTRAMSSKETFDALTHMVRREIEQHGAYTLDGEDLEKLWGPGRALSFNEKSMATQNFARMYGFLVQVRESPLSATFKVAR